MSADAITLPANFHEEVSTTLLRQPQPQRFWAMLVTAAEAKAALTEAGMIGLPGRESPTSGAAYASEFDKLMLAAHTECAEAIQTIEREGARPGATIAMNRPAFSGGGYTEDDRQIGPNNTISVTPIDISQEQAKVTIKRVVGPMAAGGTTPQPYAIDSFDASMGVHRLKDIVGLALKYDRESYLDNVIASRFNGASTNIVYTGQATADDDYLTEETGQLDVETLFRVEEKLTAANIPTFSNGRWKQTLTPRALRQLKSDSAYAHYAQNLTAFNPLFPGYVTTIGQLDLYQVNTYPAAVDNSSSVAVYRNIAFGPGAIGYGVGKRPTVQPSTDDNYGETPKVIWCAYEGSAILDERFLLSLRTS